MDFIFIFKSPTQKDQVCQNRALAICADLPPAKREANSPFPCLLMAFFFMFSVILIFKAAVILNNLFYFKKKIEGTYTEDSLYRNPQDLFALCGRLK